MLYGFCYSLNDKCNEEPTLAGDYWHDCYWYNIGCENAPAVELPAEEAMNWDDDKAHSGAVTLAATILAFGTALIAF